MKRAACGILAAALTLAPALARGDCRSFSQCVLGFEQLGRVTGGFAEASAAVGGTVLAAGAIGTLLHQSLHLRPLPPGAVADSSRAGAHLALIPSSAPPVGSTEYAQPGGYAGFNETATNVMLGVTGAMVLGAAITAIVKAAK